MKRNRVVEAPLRHHVQKIFNKLVGVPEGHVTIARIHPKTGAKIQIEVEYHLSKDQPEVQIGNAVNMETGAEVWLSAAEKQEVDELAWRSMKEMGSFKESRMIKTTVGELRRAISRFLVTEAPTRRSSTSVIFERELPDESVVEVIVDYSTVGSYMKATRDSPEEFPEVQLGGAFLEDGTPTQLTPEEEQYVLVLAQEDIDNTPPESDYDDDNYGSGRYEDY